MNRRHTWGAGAVLCMAALALGAIYNPQVLPSYLVGWTYWMGLALGALLLVALTDVTGGTWLLPLRRNVQRLSLALPPLGLLFVPVLCALPHVYSWAQPEGMQTHAVLVKAAWLNTSAFVSRSIVYLGVWGALAELSWRATRCASRLSAATLPVVGLTATFAFFDWFMALTPEWHSSIYGVYMLAGGFVAALAATTCIATYLARDAAHGIEVRQFYALGRMLLAFVMFWAYIAFSQLIVVSMADLPEELPWYTVRFAAGWGNLAWLLGLAHFAVPFACLLSWQLKQRGLWITLIAALLLLAHYLDVFWLLMPALQRDSAIPQWYDLVIWLTQGAALTAYLVWRDANKELA